MGIVILKKAYSGALVKVSVVITIKKTIIMTIVNNDNNNSNNNNNDSFLELHDIYLLIDTV